MLGLLAGDPVGLVLSLLVQQGDGSRRPQAIRGALAALVVIALPLLVYMELNSTPGTEDAGSAPPGRWPSRAPSSAAASTTQANQHEPAIFPTRQLHLAVLPAAAPLHDKVHFHDLPASRDLVQWLHRAVRLARLPASPAGSTRRVRWRSPSGCSRWRRSSWSGCGRWCARGSGSCPPTSRRGLRPPLRSRGRLSGAAWGAAGYEQPRYLFPLLALYGALIALAARGAGRRYGPAGGRPDRLHRDRPHGGAMLLTLTRYYG